LAAYFAMIIVGHGMVAAEPTVVNLTQTGCQFLEPEGKDYQFKTQTAADCKAINTQNGDEWLHGVTPLELKPGEYIFRVTNHNVPYDLGFYLRGTGLGRSPCPKSLAAA
jgi:hypothetical protein